jgi:hypothetical protein
VGCDHGRRSKPQAIVVRAVTPKINAEHPLGDSDPKETCRFCTSIRMNTLMGDL